MSDPIRMPASYDDDLAREPEYIPLDGEEAGPYETEREAHEAAIASIPPREGWVILSGKQNRQLLTQACEQAGVTLGAYDQRIIDWLSGYEDATCMVIAGLIARAHGNHR